MIVRQRGEYATLRTALQARLCDEVEAAIRPAPRSWGLPLNAPTTRAALPPARARRSITAERAPAASTRNAMFMRLRKKTIITSSMITATKPTQVAVSEAGG